MQLPDAPTRRIKRPADLDLWPFDLESSVQVTCDVGYLCATLVFLGLSVIDLGPMYATDVRRQTASSLYAPPIRGGA